ncbi:hypothetical protein CALCODRAFT_222589 [Calocera cornea HHB12733]|uniref:Methyltransferase domain-containing protein n=1 Tax=Calocera cornea HHB12733 TaxID=1353952 RepID=A0A165H4X9_9BASI|nr:hypothetical protein CALCODRAFT_222589 [Calocera cornea HHB12733]
MAHPIPHPHTSPPPPDGPPDLDALASHVYRPRHPLPARPRTSLLRVPWPGARDGLAPSASGAPRKQHQHLTVTRGGAAGALGSRRSTDVRHAAGISISGLAGGDGDQSESDDEGEEGGWEGEREEKWLDPRFAWAGRERQHKAAMPYPLSYGEALLNYQIATVDIIRRVKGSATYHLFERTQQPTKCLDIGCGTGTWIAAAAQEWPDCVFVGVDAAPVQPRIGRRSALYGRVSWVNCDWLEGLPFEEETFDHVHCWFVSSGVPETKWFDFFEEITRVMKPGATFEFVDEDIIFPALTKPAPSPRSSVNPAYAAAAAVAASASSASFASGSSTAAAGSTPSTTAPSVGDHSSINTSTVVGPGPGSAEALTLTRASGSGSSGSLGLSLRPTTSNGTSGTGSGSGTGTARTGGTGGPYTLSREELLGLPEEHDHSLIEKLFNEVFQGRGINMEPTGGVQMYINMYLMEVQVRARADCGGWVLIWLGGLMGIVQPAVGLPCAGLGREGGAEDAALRY